MAKKATPLATVDSAGTFGDRVCLMATAVNAKICPIHMGCYTGYQTIMVRLATYSLIRSANRGTLDWRPAIGNGRRGASVGEVSTDRWRRIRTLFEAGEVPVSKIARRCGVSRQQIMPVADRRAWLRGSRPGVHKSTRVTKTETSVAVIAPAANHSNDVKPADASVWAMPSGHRCALEGAKMIEKRLACWLAEDVKREVTPTPTAVNAYGKLLRSTAKRFGLERQAYGLRDYDAAPPEQVGQQFCPRKSLLSVLRLPSKRLNGRDQIEWHTTPRINQWIGTVLRLRRSMFGPRQGSHLPVRISAVF